MDGAQNPFKPNAGEKPPFLAGRSKISKDTGAALKLLKSGSTARSNLFVGLRGTGKTVLLTQAEQMAKDENLITIVHEGDGRDSLGRDLVLKVRKAAFSLKVGAKVSEGVNKLLGVAINFANTVGVKIDDTIYGLEIKPQPGIADSGDLKNDLIDLLETVGEVAKQHKKKTGLVLILDEMQDIQEKELTALVMALHRTTQLNLPVTLFGAGLPDTLGKLSNARSYSERLFTSTTINALEASDARAALQEAVQKRGVKFTAPALTEIINQSEGYPFFLQQWGHSAWGCAKGQTIGLNDVKNARHEVVAELDHSFYRFRLEQCPAKEKEYLRAMAELGPGPQETSAIAEVFDQASSDLAGRRGRLIKRGLLFSQERGKVEYTVPKFDEYLKRTIDWP